MLGDVVREQVACREAVTVPQSAFLIDLTQISSMLRHATCRSVTYAAQALPSNMPCSVGSCEQTGNAAMYTPITVDRQASLGSP